MTHAGEKAALESLAALSCTVLSSSSAYSAIATCLAATAKWTSIPSPSRTSMTSTWKESEEGRRDAETEKEETLIRLVVCKRSKPALLMARR